MIFTILILLFLWLFLIVFLQSYYKAMKIRDIKKAASVISNAYGAQNFEDILEQLAFENNMCIEIEDMYGQRLYSIEMMGGNCLIHRDFGVRLYGWRQELKDSASGDLYYSFDDDKVKTKMLVYGKLLGTKDDIKGYIFLNSSVEPIGSTSAIITEQLFYITLIILELALISTLFISKKLSRPIMNITKSAQEFAKGDYSVVFEGKEYREVEQLADVLNYAGREISKVDGLRRELISNISHDLRTPLTIIKAYAEMVRDLSGENPVKRDEHIKIIIDESDRLTNLVNGLLELSKLESGNNKLVYSEFSIHEKLDEVLERYSIYEERDGYKFELIKDEDRVLCADVAKIEQVLYNFINNAVNYSGEDKKIIIRQINKQNSTRIEISDNGEGIPQEKLPLIFDRYYREKKSEREVVGTGLGLSIVKEILKLHQFPFGVQSEIGKGSTFWFEITK